MAASDGAAPAPLRRNRDFMLLWSGQSLSVLGTEVSAVAFPLLVLTLTGSPAQAGIVAFAQTLPSCSCICRRVRSSIASTAVG